MFTAFLKDHFSATKANYKNRVHRNDSEHYNSWGNRKMKITPKTFFECFSRFAVEEKQNEPLYLFFSRNFCPSPQKLEYEPANITITVYTA